MYKIPCRHRVKIQSDKFDRSEAAGTYFTLTSYARREILRSNTYISVTQIEIL